MKGKIALTLTIPLLISAVLASTALAATMAILVSFNGGIGVIPVSSGQGTENIATVVNRNLVRGVQPPGQIWVIDDLVAKVFADGQITVRGKGLVLGGGDNVGRATGQSVFATLFCGAVAPFTESSTNLAGVPLATDGDFTINDVLTPTPPTPCDSPVLLIRNAGNLAWFAAGIPRANNVVPDEMEAVPPMDNPPPAPAEPTPMP
ncbi:hypothetical protein [Pseudomonas sp. LFM046]|uniref:hypothetical protein n=1 Tax=Pseudomonas sp. LFM046 TaxID=1608357 RepID=UPI0005CFD152|nr:hypothetical protein [Pseudomonas sp. LFM046]